MKLLSIGNSFSDDAHAYLKSVADAAGTYLFAGNMTIGGCSLEQHFRYMKGREERYSYVLNGNTTGLFLHLDKALLSQNWDVITLQQVSHCAPRYETYQPYLNALVAHVRELCPKAKLYLQETWAYEEGSHRLTTELGYKSQADMYRDVRASYEQAAKDIAADGIIPSGTAFQQLLAGGAEKIHRDTFHADMGIGRLTLALTWLRALTGVKPTEIDLSAVRTTKPVTAQEIALAQKAAEDACTLRGL